MAEADTRYSAVHSEYVNVERQVLQDNIILCDTKSSILLGFGVLMLLWCFDRISERAAASGTVVPLLVNIELSLYGLAALALLVAIVFGARATKPRLRRSDDYIFWGSNVFKSSEADYVSAVRSAAPDNLTADMFRHLHVLAGVCCEKYENFERAITAAQFAALFILLAVCVRILSGIT